MKTIKLVEQLQESDCGLACLSMLLGYYDYNISLKELKKEYLISQQGLSFNDLIFISKEYGFDLMGFSIDKDANLDQLSSECPFIASWDQGKHYVVVERIKYGKYIILDPNAGRLILSKTEFEETFNNKLLKVITSNNKKRRPDKDKYKSIKKMIKEMLINNKTLLFVFFVIGSLSQLINVLPPLIYGNLLDRVISEDYSINVKMIVTIFGLILSLFLVALGQEFIKIKLEYNMDYSLLTKYYKHLINLPISFFKNKNQGELIYRFNLLEKFKEIVVTHGVGAIFSIILIIVYSILMLSISVEMGLVVIILALLFIMFLTMFSSIAIMLSKKVVLSNAKSQEYLAESIKLIDAIKLNSQEKNVEKEMNSLLDKYLLNTKKGRIVSTLIDSGVATIKVVQTMITFLIGLYFLKNELITIGQLLSFVVLSESFFIPIYSLIDSYFFMVNLSTTFAKVSEVLEEKSEDQTNKKLKKIGEIDGRIEFKNVYFRYSSFGPYVLENFSLIINPGETIRILGDSGTGKSTLIKLLAGYYQLENGEINIDGNDIRTVNKKNYREKVSIILKESQLFSGSIKENVFGDNKIQCSSCSLIIKEAIYNILSQANLSFDTRVSEGGNNLSEGQKQRVLIAKSLYKNSKIIIWDEATNSLDKTSEDYIFSILEQIEATKIIVSHDEISLKSDRDIYLSDY
ncbi:toxin secretion ABC transporter, ATP-binding/permease protein [Enterococcus faecalis AZ19]|uniref:peptidase domain-containing ABC transporter n=2 Tax=Enterococcus faecalis TaxID=1351 RepID=UPI0004596C4B|nr:peptidase domain-containing ABC transporter [Enterococcus faecalis]KAJ72248.1 toxin secretion ABC transporter, ATP-binding/permease protein [Enterococcus faecalis AZ19]MDE3930025.1 peptidase domain-containing ABC transporter [Enterococcus faecalis]HAP5185792.1 peptidase domain-containing ABC transporter [Enterococcus faecalis]HCY9007878.1 peptidase domain-containing ABC transporter [Enterococcus faecalis]HEL7530191.1 peptidase domain-containing ABC transporter [Enterococcus faecalis]